MKTLTIDEILAVDDVRVEEVEVPEWGGKVCIRTIDGTRCERIEQADGNHAAVVIGLCLCDENGKYLNPTASQLEGLARKSASALLKVFRAAAELNQLNPKALEEEEGN